MTKMLSASGAGGLRPQPLTPSAAYGCDYPLFWVDTIEIVKHMWAALPKTGPANYYC